MQTSGTPTIVPEDALLAGAHGGARPASGAGELVEPLASQLRTRKLEAKIARDIQRNFPNFSSVQIDVLQKEGLTLRERITRDNLKMAEPGNHISTLGSLYFQQLREMYVAEKIVAADSLVVIDESNADDEDVRQALLALCWSNSQTELLSRWFESVAVVNQKVFVMVCRALLQTDPGQHLKQAMLVCDFMKMVMRLELDKVYVVEVDVMRGHCDRALQKHLAHYKAHDIRSATQWWQSVSTYAGLVLPTQAVQNILENANYWKSVGGDLALVMTSSGVGKMLFQHAKDAQQRADLEAVMEELIGELLSGDVTQESVARVLEMFRQTLASMGIDACDEPCNAATVMYRGVEVHLQCRSHMEVFNAHIEATIRTEGVNLNLVDAMPWENDLVKSKKPRVKHVETFLLLPTICGRKAAAEFMYQSMGCGFRKALENNQKSVCETDEYFKIEVGFWRAFLGKNAIVRAREAILSSYVDSRGQPHNVKQSRENLMVWRHHRLFQLCGVNAQDLLNFCIQFGAEFFAGIPVDWGAFSKHGSPFACKLRDAMVNSMDVSRGEQGTMNTCSPKRTNAEISEVLENVMGNLLEKLLSRDITCSSVKEVREAFTKELTSMADHTAAVRCTAIVPYRGVKVQVRCASFQEWFDLHVEAAIRTEAVNLNLLGAMSGEDDLVTSKTPRVQHVEDVLLVATKVARQTLGLYMREATATTLPAILVKVGWLLCDLDRKFKIELEFWRVSLEKTLNGRVHDAILQCFSDSQGQPLTFEQCKEKLVAFRGTRLFQLAGAQLMFVHAMCVKFADGIFEAPAQEIRTMPDSDFAEKLDVAMGKVLKKELTGDARYESTILSLFTQMGDGLQEKNGTDAGLRLLQQAVQRIKPAPGKHEEDAVNMAARETLPADPAEHAQAQVALSWPVPEAKKAKIG